MGCCGINSSKNFSNVLCCIPLAPFILLISSLLVTWGSFEIYAIWAHGVLWQPWAILSFFMSGLSVLSGVGGIIAVVLRLSFGLSIMALLYKIDVAWMVVTLTAAWVTLGLELSGRSRDGKAVGRWHPTTSEWSHMIFLTVVNVLGLVFMWWILSAINSLKHVIDAGGNGWEGMSAQELEKEERTALLP